MRAALVSLGALVALWAAILFGNADAGEQGNKKARDIVVHVVKMTAGNKFDPDSLDVKVGDQVKFVNPDGPSHTATSDDIKTGDPKKTFNTGVVKKGQDASITLNNEMTYKYHCEFHTGMTGTINVKP